MSLLKIILIFLAFFTSFSINAKYEDKALEKALFNYLGVSNVAMGKVGVPAGDRCELKTKNDEFEESRKATYLSYFNSHYNAEGPHSWDSCSLEEVTLGCQIFTKDENNILSLTPPSLTGVLPTHSLYHLTDLRAQNNLNEVDFRQAIDAGISPQDFFRERNIDSNNFNVWPPRLKKISAIYDEENKFLSLSNYQEIKAVTILKNNPECLLEPFFHKFSKEENTLMICPAIAVLPNPIVASILSKELFLGLDQKQKSKIQTEHGLNLIAEGSENEALIYSKYRLVAQIKNAGVTNLRLPEQRILMLYPESLYFCLNNQKEKKWDERSRLTLRLPFVRDVLNCPRNQGDKTP